ncbi:MAG: hypothetical protein ACTHOD_21630 [Motilibacteraceae bacterium]
MHHPAQPTPLPRTALPEHARPVSDLIERVLKQRPQARVDVVIRLVRATLAHPAWERLPADEAAARAERIVLAQLARLPSPRADSDRAPEVSAAAGSGVGRASIDVTERRHPVSR